MVISPHQNMALKGDGWNIPFSFLHKNKLGGTNRDLWVRKS